jgi:hypothetical protein
VLTAEHHETKEKLGERFEKEQIKKQKETDHFYVNKNENFEKKD